MRISPFFWAVFGVLGLALVLLLLRGPETTDGLSGNRAVQAVYLLALLAFVIAGVVGRGWFGRTARYATIWGAIVVVALVGYTYREELQVVWERVTGELFTSEPAVKQEVAGETVIIAQQRRSNHFIASAIVNNASIDMLVDTGASVVTLTLADARLAGVTTRDLRYVVPVATANGTAMAAPVILDRIAIGPIEQRRVAALVAEEGVLEQSLLGLNFLQGLTSYTFAGNQLILTP